MPIYEYKCKKCSYQFELLQKASDPLPDSCPNCGDDKLTKLISSTSFQLKGSGWYETDFKNKKAGEKKEADCGAGKCCETTSNSCCCNQKKAKTTSCDSKGSSSK